MDQSKPALKQTDVQVLPHTCFDASILASSDLLGVSLAVPISSSEAISETAAVHNFLTTIRDPSFDTHIF